MFNKDKKPNEIRAANQKPTEKTGVIVNKESSPQPRENKDSKQAKSDMQSEGGCS